MTIDTSKTISPNNSILRQAFTGGSWLALYRSISQGISWAVTIIVARILTPGDYGLMEMATILTGYVLLFSELGLGAAIIQKESIDDNELSSLFWFLAGWGILLSIVCFFLAYPTVAIFGENRILHVTQAVSVLFLIGALLIIPRNILHRKLRFRQMGFIDTCATVISSAAMVGIAMLGGGVWTLIGGHIIREFLRLIIMFFSVEWRPRFHFEASDIKPFLKFGLNLAVGNSIRYVYMKSDRFFGGKLLGTQPLGFYSLALQLSSIPTDKIVALINSVSLPVFSRFQNDVGEFNNFFLKLNNVIASLIFPLFFGGVFIADLLIPVVLGDKWGPIIWPFRMLCLAQLVISISSTCSVANISQNRPNWVLVLNVAYFLCMPVSFYFSASRGLDFIALPWLTIFPLIAIIYTLKTVSRLGVEIRSYLKAYLHPAAGTIFMLLALFGFKYLYFNGFDVPPFRMEVYLGAAIVIGALSYLAYIIKFDPKLVARIRKLMARN